jgi:hypothetical protein
MNNTPIYSQPSFVENVTSPVTSRNILVFPAVKCYDPRNGDVTFLGWFYRVNWRCVTDVTTLRHFAEKSGDVGKRVKTYIFSTPYANTRNRRNTRHGRKITFPYMGVQEANELTA